VAISSFTTEATPLAIPNINSTAGTYLCDNYHCAESKKYPDKDPLSSTRPPDANADDGVDAVIVAIVVVICALMTTSFCLCF